MGTNNKCNINYLTTSNDSNKKTTKKHAANLIVHICLEAATVAQTAHSYSRLSADGGTVTFFQSSSCSAQVTYLLAVIAIEFSKC